MEPLRPLFWHQGMLLQPQHFQQQDHYHDGRLYHFLRLLFPFCWGIHSLRISESRLQNFTFEIEQCEVVTFDGTLLRFGSDAHPSTARVEPRSFEQELDAGGKPLSVYLGLRRLRPGEPNLHDRDGTPGNPGGGSHRRFVLEEAEVSDQLTGGESLCQVQYLICDAQLLFDVLERAISGLRTCQDCRSSSLRRRQGGCTFAGIHTGLPDSSIIAGS